MTNDNEQRNATTERHEQLRAVSALFESLRIHTGAVF